MQLESRTFVIWFLAAFSLYLCLIVITGFLQKPEVSDLAVVLGNEVLASGEPSDRLKARLDCAVQLYRRHLTKRILASGGVGRSGYDEASVMEKYLKRQGVSAQDILIDSQGVNTMATARNTAALVRREHYRGVIAVSQYYHLPRTLIAFRKAGIDTRSADYPRYFEWADFYSILREGVALPVYLLKNIE